MLSNGEVRVNTFFANLSQSFMLKLKTRVSNLVSRLSECSLDQGMLKESSNVVITVALVCLMSLPLLMLIMGVQYLRDCPVEPHIPVYMVVGGSFGTLKMAWLLWRQVRSRRYERLDLTTPLQEIDAGMSAGTRVISAALTVFLIVWFALGNYWILHIAWPDYELKLYDPNRWCHKTLYIFAVVHLAILYGIMVLLVLFALSLSLCQLLACPFFIRYK